MLTTIERYLGISLRRFMRAHQLPVGLTIMMLAPAFQLARVF